MEEENHEVFEDDFKMLALLEADIEMQIALTQTDCQSIVYTNAARLIMLASLVGELLGENVKLQHLWLALNAVSSSSTWSLQFLANRFFSCEILHR